MKTTMGTEYRRIRAALRSVRWARLHAASGTDHRPDRVVARAVRGLDALAVFREPGGEQWLRTAATPPVGDPAAFVRAVEIELLQAAAAFSDTPSGEPHFALAN